MKYWIGTLAFALYLAPWQAWDKPEEWKGSEHDIYVFEADEGRGLAVVTPDPFLDDADWGMRVWRADVHVRVGGRTVAEELVFRAERIDTDTLIFLETVWGPEVHVFEANPELGEDAKHRRRWVVRADGFEELNPARGHGPF